MVDDWPLATPSQVGMDGGLLEELAPQFEAWREANLHGVVMIRRGKLVFDRYFEGEDERYGRPLGRVAHGPERLHDLRSISKSVLSLLFGVGFDRGWFGDMDRPILDFFPEHQDLRPWPVAGVTLRHALTMSAGMQWNEYLPYSNPENSERRMIEAPDRARFVLEQPIARPPGITYNYNGGLTELLAIILTRRAGRPLQDFAREALFDPLGISEVEWITYADGAPSAVSGLRLRPRDVARIGWMVLKGGIWRDQKLISQRWIDESTAPHMNGEGLFFYGYQWWLGRSLVKRQEIRWVSAVGWGGQRMFIVPSLDLVVVVTAGLYGSPMMQSIPGEVVLRRYALASCV